MHQPNPQGCVHAGDTQRDFPALINGHVLFSKDAWLCRNLPDKCRRLLKAWLLFVAGSMYFTAGDKISIRAGLPDGDNQQGNSPCPLFPLPPGWQASGKKCWIQHVPACIWDCLGCGRSCPVLVKQEGWLGLSSSTPLVHSVGCTHPLIQGVKTKKCRQKKNPHQITLKTQISPNLIDDASCTPRREQAAH